jgi:broad specificity phosphatase PhoE
MHPDAWLIRHGQSATNAGGLAQIPAEIGLTALGMEQAEKLAASIDRRPSQIVTSHFKRSRQSAVPIERRWPGSACNTWPIEEITYLSPASILGSSFEERKEMTRSYWEKCDPMHRDGPDAETFLEFIDRLRYFHAALKRTKGFVVVVGHGQFLRAYQLGIVRGFPASREWMLEFRQMEIRQPLKNCEILKTESLWKGEL